MIMWRYKFLLFIIFIPLALYTLWQSLRMFELRYFIQRLAFFYAGEFRSGGIWIHAASVGEVNAVIPLIIKIRAEKPDTIITLTTNTISGASIIKKQLPESIQHFYFPLDYRYSVKRFINKLKPNAIFIVETELWPNLYQLANARKIPLMIINGRISEKTLRAKNWLKKIYAEILPLVEKVYARSDTDKTRFITLGLAAAKIEVLGNIKFSASLLQQVEPLTFAMPYVLAASTRDEEEQLIVDAWLKSGIKNHLLIIVPRHPDRLHALMEQLKKFNCSIAVRSKNDPVTTTTQVYIADTIGELKHFIAGAEFVVMGGSFVEKGGHNILEVAQLGKAVIFGPDMRSFADEAKLFIDYDAGTQCTLEQLPERFNRLLSDNHYRNKLENNARKLISENNNIEKYYAELIPYFV